MTVTSPSQKKNRDGHTLTDIAGGAGSEAYALKPGVKKSNSNLFHLPKSACDAVSVSTVMVSQVSTGLGSALSLKRLCREHFVSVSSRFVATEDAD